MSKSRKYIADLLSSVKFQKNKYEYIQKEITRLMGQQEYERTIQHYDKLIAKLNEELLSLPIGYRYKGVFYIKDSYTLPATFEKCEGVVYLREDLVSWQIEEGLKRADPGYHRNIFKHPTDGAELKREDAEPVYAKPK